MNRSVSIATFLLVCISCATVNARPPFRIYNDAPVSRVVYRPSVVQTRTITPTIERDAIRSMHILERPNRVGHFYGNTVRRVHHSGNVLPRLRRR